MELNHHILRLYHHIKHRIQGKIPPGKARSPHWETFRKHWLENHGACEVCGRTSGLEVHHKKPFHDHPEDELKESNVITLCETGTNCHLNYGHAGDFKGYNPGVAVDANEWHRKFEHSRELAKKGGGGT
jgi:5-methylcytosine-specific restriction enzyme A